MEKTPNQKKNVSGGILVFNFEISTLHVLLLG
jgi:hypothetical protein